ncbi:uncharacterized protein [Linepithema humile]|uniref:uncharacterized protein isoform X1 n=3 Tax=Linepithema humile TaxID=83485 RepID=UPI00351E04FE
MQLATQVILSYLSIALSDGSEFLSYLYKDVINFSYVDKKPRYMEDVNYFPDNVPNVPYIAQLKDEKKVNYLYEIPPNNLYYTQPKSEENTRPIKLVAGLDNLRPIDESFCLNDVLRANSSLSSRVQCARTCRKGDRRICYYNFVVENYRINGPACNLCTPDSINVFCSTCECVLADGVERSARIVNRQMPGPAIEVCEGDHVVIDVSNHMSGSDLSIHWHGLFQKGFQYYDGVPFITQCPIVEDTTFRYQWRANNPGTHFWHAHSSLQKMDGIFGSIIVRQPAEVDPHSHLYDYDLSTHVLVISDWMHEEAVSFPERRFFKVGARPDSILINGKGRYTDLETGITTNTTLEVIDVEPGKRYRIRLINAFCTVCPGLLSIQDHKLSVIASDGLDIKPVTVDSITSFAGERYDFILHANKTVGSYWIQVRGLGDCAALGVQQLAILRYKDAPSKPSLQSPSYNKALPQGLVLNALNATCEVPTENTICVSNLNSIGPIDKNILQQEPDLKFYLPVSFYQYAPQEFFQPNNMYMVSEDGNLLNAVVDGISFKFPPSPPLSQPEDIPSNQYCNENTLFEHCPGNGACTCTHKLNIPLNSIVEILLIDELQVTNLTHPFHMHGHAFYVMSMGRTNVSSINWKIVWEMDRKQQVNRCFDKPVMKDTVIIPYNGYTILRFHADNPGYWLFHCHFIYHQMVGMSVLLHVGEQEDIPPVPKNFPKCGGYSPPIEYSAYSLFIRT